MNKPTPPDDQDPVWDLLDQAPMAQASPRFVDDTVRAARLMADSRPWWKQFLAARPYPTLAAAAAILMLLAVILLQQPASRGTAISYDSPQAESIEEIAETEILLAAADNLSEFSDQELVALIGF